MRSPISNSWRLVATSALSLILLDLFQPAQSQDLRAGLKVGLNAANLYGDDVPGTDARLLFSGGGFLTYQPTAYFAMQPELLFSAKGADVNVSGQTVTQDFGYLEIPLLAKFYVPSNGGIRPNLFAGPALGVLLHAEADGIDIYDEMEETDVGLVLGGGLDFNIGPRTLLLDARYTFGFTDAFAPTGGNELTRAAPSEPNARNGAFTVSVGIAF